MKSALAFLSSAIAWSTIALWLMSNQTDKITELSPQHPIHYFRTITDHYQKDLPKGFYSETISEPMTVTKGVPDEFYEEDQEGTDLNISDIQIVILEDDGIDFSKDEVSLESINENAFSYVDLIEHQIGLEDELIDLKLDLEDEIIREFSEG